MGAVGKKLRSMAGDQRRGYMHWCPGCDEPHGIFTENKNGPAWTFNGDFEAPTFGPSVRCFTTDPDTKQERTLCHYFVKAGKIEFCGDSPHALAGKIVDLPDWPYAPGAYGGIED